MATDITITLFKKQRLEEKTPTGLEKKSGDGTKDNGGANREQSSVVGLFNAR